MKKHWSLILGASLITGLAGTLFLKKNQKEQSSTLHVPQLYHTYVGSWWFINQPKATQHVLKIADDLTIFIDGKKISANLIELTNQRLVVQDEYGYHFIVQCLYNTPTSLYDEADDATYLLEATGDFDKS